MAPLLSFVLLSAAVESEVVLDVVVQDELQSVIP